MATRAPKIKHKLAYVGKGKKNPTLPEGAGGVLTIVQGEVSHELLVHRQGGAIVVAKAPLLASLGLRPVQVKNVAAVEVSMPGVKKPVEHYSLANATLIAATARVLVGASPVTGFLLAPAFEGHVGRLGNVVPEFDDLGQ